MVILLKRSFILKKIRKFPRLILCLTESLSREIHLSGLPKNAIHFINIDFSTQRIRFFLDSLSYKIITLIF